MTEEGEIMAVRHRRFTIEGVQFHPESVLTPQGPQLMGNFLKLTDALRTPRVNAELPQPARASSKRCSSGRRCRRKSRGCCSTN